MMNNRIFALNADIKMIRSIAIDRSRYHRIILQENMIIVFQIWTDTLTRNFIVIQWILAFILIIPVAFIYQFNICIDQDNRTIYFQWTKAEENALYSTVVAGLIAGVMMILIVVIYATIFTVALIREVKKTG